MKFSKRGIIKKITKKVINMRILYITNSTDIVFFKNHLPKTGGGFLYALLY